MLSKRIRLVTAVFAFAAAFTVYLLTLAPTVYFIDSGELSAVASTLGIAHPTGYPLFTIIGHMFTLLPVSDSEVYKLNLMSAVFCACAVLLFSFFMSYLLSIYNRQKDESSKHKQTARKKSSESKINLHSVVSFAIVAFSCLVLAFSKTFWAAANSVEVYPMHLFFLVSLMYVFLKSIFEERPESDPEGKLSFFAGNKYYLLFALLLGLSFTNHLTTILLAPACLTLFFVTLSRDKKRMYLLIRWMILFFLVGFSVYLYLPIRANMDPIFIWGNPYNLERFYWHVTGKQFSIWIFSAKGSIPVFLFLVAVLITLSAVGIAKQKSLSKYYHIITFAVLCILSFILLSTSSEIVIKQFNFFTNSLWKEFGTGIVLLAAPGVYLLSRSNLKLYYFTILTFFGCVFYSVNYDIHDIASYFLLAEVTIAVWIGFGALWIYFKLGEYLNSEIKKIAFSIVLILVSLVTLNTNYAENDESKNTYVEEFTMNIFRNIEPRSIVISSQWDFWVSASWYYQFVKNIRPDIVVIDKELLRRSWYYKHIERTRPEIYNNSKTEIDRFLIELDKFEHGIPYDQKTIMKTYSDMLTSFVTKNPSRKVYTTWEIEQNKNEPFAEEYSRIPDGLLFQLVHKDLLQNNAVKDYRIYNFEFTPTTVKDYYHETLMRSYSAMLTSSAQYLISINRLQDAKKYLDAALTAIPGFTQALDLKRKFNL